MPTSSDGIDERRRQFMTNVTRGRRSSVRVAWVLCVTGVLLAFGPYTQSGFYSDDVFHSTTPGLLAEKGQSIGDHIRAVHAGWANNGRFFPFSIASGTVTWRFAYSHFANRAVQLFLISASLFLGCLLLREITRGWRVPIVFLALMPALFQIRNYHDPMTSFSPLMQELVLLILASFYFFLKFLRTNRWGYYFAGLLCHALALATYEVSVVVLPILAIPIVARVGQPGWRRWVGLAGHVLLVALFLGISVYLRKHGSDRYGGTSFELGGAVGLTFFRQLVATFPLSYFVFDQKESFAGLEWPGAGLAVLASLVFLSVGGALFLGLRRISEVPRHVGINLATGAFLFVAPAAIISLSAKYQSELRWGLGYLPVYVQFFGFAILAATILSAISGWASRRNARIFQICFALVCAFSFAGISAAQVVFNFSSIEYMNSLLRYPREFLEEAAARDLFTDIPNGSVLVRDRVEPWDLASFYRQHADRSLRIVSLDKWLADAPDAELGRKIARAGVYHLNYKAEGKPGGAGWAVLGRIDKLDYRKNGDRVQALRWTIEDPRCYVRLGQKVEPSVRPAATGRRLLENGEAENVRVELAQTETIRSGKRWASLRWPKGRYSNLAVEPMTDASDTEMSAVLLNPPGSPVPPAVPVLSVQSGESDSLVIDHLAGMLFAGDVVDGETVRLAPARNSRLQLHAPGLSQSALGLAFYVRPSGEQTGYATIAGSDMENGGFALEQDGTSKAAPFGLTIATGKTWKTFGAFSLPADQWTLVILEIGPSGTRLQVIREKTELEGDWPSPPAAPAGHPSFVYLGNNWNGERPFQGQIRHMVCLDRSFEAAEVEGIISDFRRWTQDLPQ